MPTTPKTAIDIASVAINFRFIGHPNARYPRGEGRAVLSNIVRLSLWANTDDRSYWQKPRGSPLTRPAQLTGKISTFTSSDRDSRRTQTQGGNHAESIQSKWRFGFDSHITSRIPTLEGKPCAVRSPTGARKVRPEHREMFRPETSDRNFRLEAEDGIELPAFEPAL